MSAFNPGRAIVAGLVYFLLVFAAGFALGAVRTLFVAPRLGETLAVIIELPLMLVISWIACGAVLKRIDLPPQIFLRLLMGACAFEFLMIAEFALAHFAFSQSIDSFFAGLTRTPGALGLAGQIAFALFPLVRRAA